MYVANDWPVLPFAARLAEERDVPFVYDTHEFAAQEHADRLKWRVLSAPYVRHIEASFAQRATRVMTVSDGIADALVEELGLARRPTVVRNIPAHRALPVREVTGEIELLYHGVLAPDRGVEQLIRSVPLWRPGRRLVIRGIGPDEYVRKLKDLAAGNQSVRFDPPVLPKELVDRAHESDVGIHAGVGTSRQVRFSLPNKFFEYLCAGLAVCISDLPELRRLVDQYGVGAIFPSVAPEELAATVNSLNAERVNAFKQSAVVAAQELSWHKERERLLTVVAEALG